MFNIKVYKKEISSAKPQSGGCKYFYNNWVAHFPNKNILTCVSEYKERKISRYTVVKAYRNYFTEPKIGFNKPLLLTMIWGFNNAGYGPHRANNYLTGAINNRLIKESLNAVDVGDIDGAFKKLSGIDKLGVSYISKILYFACKAKDIEKYPLIFDIRVARAIVSLSTSGKFDKILDIKPAKTLRAYKEYNELLHSWAKELRVDADKIEYFLFSQSN
jgi:hypothetical protein